MTNSSQDEVIDALVAAVQAGGDMTAFEQLYKRFVRPVNHFFLHKGFSSEDARDLSQDVFVRVFKAIGTFRGEARFQTWLYEIADHVFKNAVRRLKSGKRKGWTISLQDIDSTLDSPEPDLPPSPARALDEILEQERAEALTRAIKDLPEQMRACVLLRYEHNRGYKEIATILGITIETAKAHLYQARRRLRLELSGDDDGLTITHNLAPQTKAYSTSAPALPTAPPPAQLSLSDLVDRFLAARHAKSPNTFSAYRRHLQRFLRDIGEELPTEMRLAHYHASLLLDGRGSTSHQQALAAVRGFLKWLTETKIQPLPVPPPHIVRQLLKVPPTKEKPTSAVVDSMEANALLQNASTTRDRAMVGVLLEAGLRVDEFVRLQIQDFQNQGLLLSIRPRKGGENRILPLSPVVADLVTSYLRETSRTWESSGPVFLPLPIRGGRPSRTGRLTTRAVEYRFRQILKAAGIADKKISPNSLRQAFAVRHLQETGDLKILQSILGHVSVVTTERYLRYLNPKKD